MNKSTKMVLGGAVAAVAALYAQSSVVMANEQASKDFSDAILVSKKPTKESAETFFGGIKQMTTKGTGKDLRTDNLEEFIKNAEANGYDVQVMGLAG
jgi:hypothetical protein